MWIQIAILIISAIVQRALAPKPPQPKAASLGDFNVPTASEDRRIPVAFGTITTKSPNVVWYGDLETKPIKKKGGKK